MAGRAIDREKARAAILQALKAAATREAAAEYAGIDRITLWRWLKDDETFATEVRNAESSWQVQATALMLKAAVSGSWQAALALLERHPQSKQLWKRIDQHDMSVIPTPRLLEMLAAAEEGVESAGDRAAAAEEQLPALSE
jgi:hypothetical protein